MFKSKKKESVLLSLSKIPQRHFTDAEKEFLKLKMEYSRLQREHARLVLEKGVFVYVGAFVLAIFAKISNSAFLTPAVSNLLILGGVFILVVSIIPYAKLAKRQKEDIENILNELLGR